MNRLTRFRELLGRLAPNAARLPEVFVPPFGGLVNRLARRLELEPSSTHLICGPIGSGKTTTLLGVAALLKERLAGTSDRFWMIDVSREHRMDAEKLKGVLISLAGLKVSPASTDISSAEVTQADQELLHFAHGFTEWIEPWEDYPEEEALGLVPINHPATLKPPAHGSVTRLIQPLRILRQGHASMLLFDSLDRLESTDRFREAVEHDLPCLKRAGYGAVVVGPLRFALSSDRSVAKLFDEVHTIPTPNPETPEGALFLHQVLRSRVPADAIHDRALEDLATASGGLVRDLLSLAASALREAYERGHDSVDGDDVREAKLALGQTKRVGLDDAGRKMLEDLLRGVKFDLTRERSLVLVERGQVVETGVGEWHVHPALEDVLRGGSVAA